MYSPPLTGGQLPGGPGYYVKTEMSAGNQGQNIGSLNPNFLAVGPAGGKSTDSQGGGGGGFYSYGNNTVPTHANGERDRLITENYGQMQA